ncbi:MAG: hypothetical protein JWR84_2994 [Caulobacter sp.]|nr:hypothetical protein [Caulobacter sp.]
MTTQAMRPMRWPGRLWWGLAGLLSLLVAVFSYRYLAGVGPLAPNVLANTFAAPWLIVHVAGAATALLIGSFQFIGPLRRRVPVAHRWTGRVYAVGCLVGGVGGLMLAPGSTAGPVAAAGFAVLAMFWLTTTTLGWRTAVARDFVAHRRWMIRSWALTLAAVTLRLYMVGTPLIPVDPVDGYRAIAWLCWVPNLLIAELYLRRA